MPETLLSAEHANSVGWNASVRPDDDSSAAEVWNREDFCREQVRGLVRQVFFSSAEHPVRQVILSAVDPEKNILSICRRVGEALSLETKASVAVVGRFPEIVDLRKVEIDEQHGISENGFRQYATKRANLAWVPKDPDCSRSAGALHTFLGQVRRRFEYSVVEAECATESYERMAMSQFADGIILVLSAHYTRRAVARKVKASLEASKAHLLGAILCDRTFPIPEAIYRRL